MNDQFAEKNVSEKETLEFFSEGLRAASSAARQLAQAQNNLIWEDVSKLLDEMHNSALTLARSKALTRQETLRNLDQRESFLLNDLNASRPDPAKKFLIN